MAPARADHNQKLLSIANSRLNCLQAAADVVASVWAKAWERRATFDPNRGDVGRWLGVMLRSAIADHWRAQRVTLLTLQEHDEPAAPECEWPDLAAAIDALPAHWAAAVRAVYLDEHWFPEAAKVLNCSVGTAFNWARDGVRQLRAMLAA